VKTPISLIIASLCITFWLFSEQLSAVAVTFLHWVFEQSLPSSEALAKWAGIGCFVLAVLQLIWCRRASESHMRYPKMHRRRQRKMRPKFIRIGRRLRRSRFTGQRPLKAPHGDQLFD
jgi:hypothetical protein